MCNGVPLSVVVCPPRYMDRVADSWISSTHCTNAFEYAAALATIRYIEKHHVIEYLWSIGRRIINGINGLTREASVEAEAAGFPPTPDLVFRYNEPQTKGIDKKAFT